MTSMRLTSPAETAARFSLQVKIAGLLFLAMTITGCQHLSHDTVPRDRRGYADAIGASWKEEMLLNIVKHRYLDTPVYLDISSIVSSYSYQQKASIEATIFPGSEEAGSRVLGIGGKITESPTISYAPLTGEQLSNSLLRPIPPETIFAMLVSGRRADFLLRATVLSINGIRNSAAARVQPQADPDRFNLVVDALDRINATGGVGVIIEKTEDGNAAYITLDDGGDVETASQIQRLRDVLQLDSGIARYPLIFGGRRQPGQVTLLTRSMQQVIGELAAGVSVPSRDIEEGRATALATTNASPAMPLIRIASGESAPADAYARVRYRDRWFWIDDRDIPSKRMFVFLLLFWSLVNSGTQPNLPVMTLPVR